MVVLRMAVRMAAKSSTAPTAAAVRRDAPEHRSSRCPVAEDPEVLELLVRALVAIRAEQLPEMLPAVEILDDLEALAVTKVPHLVPVAGGVRSARRQPSTRGGAFVEHQDGSTALQACVERVQEVSPASCVHMGEPERGEPGVERPPIGGRSVGVGAAEGDFRSSVVS